MSIWQSTGEVIFPSGNDSWLTARRGLRRKVRISSGNSDFRRILMEPAEPCNITPLGDDGYPLDWPAGDPRWQRSTE